MEILHLMNIFDLSRLSRMTCGTVRIPRSLRRSFLMSFVSDPLKASVGIYPVNAGISLSFPKAFRNESFLKWVMTFLIIIIRKLGGAISKITAEITSEIIAEVIFEKWSPRSELRDHSGDHLGDDLRCDLRCDLQSDLRNCTTKLLYNYSSDTKYFGNQDQWAKSGSRIPKNEPKWAKSGSETPEN